MCRPASGPADRTTPRLVSNIAIHSVRRLAASRASHRWRIASAVVPIAIAELTVTCEEVRELSPAAVLLLETLRLFENEGGHATVADLANFSGICDNAIMAAILLPLAGQGLVFIDGEFVRPNPALTIESDHARIVVEKEEQICVIGSPPMPGLGIDRQRLRMLHAFDTDTPSVTVGEADLDGWRAEFWEAGTHRLQLREPLQPRLYVLEGCATDDGVFQLCDDQQSVRFHLSAEHPFRKQLRAETRPILEAVPQLLSPFGIWDVEKSELLCTAEQWGRWCAAQGGDVSEVTFQGSIHVAIDVFCRPADAMAASAMLLSNVLEELDTGSGPCNTTEVERVVNHQRNHTMLLPHDLRLPTLIHVEAVAWESGRWELAYRIARTVDGL